MDKILTKEECYEKAVREETAKNKYVTLEKVIYAAMDIYASQFERPDNDSDEWIYWKEGLPEETSLVMVWVEEVNQAVKHYYNGQKWKNQENILLPEFYEIKFWQPLLHQPVKKINHV